MSLFEAALISPLAQSLTRQVDVEPHHGVCDCDRASSARLRGVAIGSFSSPRCRPNNVAGSVPSTFKAATMVVTGDPENERRNTTAQPIADQYLFPPRLPQELSPTAFSAKRQWEQKFGRPCPYAQAAGSGCPHARCAVIKPSLRTTGSPPDACPPHHEYGSSRRVFGSGFAREPDESIREPQAFAFAWEGDVYGSRGIIAAAGSGSTAARLATGARRGKRKACWSVVHGKPGRWRRSPTLLDIHQRVIKAALLELSRRRQGPFENLSESCREVYDEQGRFEAREPPPEAEARRAQSLRSDAGGHSDARRCSSAQEARAFQGTLRRQRSAGERKTRPSTAQGHSAVLLPPFKDSNEQWQIPLLRSRPAAKRDTENIREIRRRDGKRAHRTLTPAPSPVVGGARTACDSSSIPSGRCKPRRNVTIVDGPEDAEPHKRVGLGGQEMAAITQDCVRQSFKEGVQNDALVSNAKEAYESGCTFFLAPGREAKVPAELRREEGTESSGLISVASAEMHAVARECVQSSLSEGLDAYLQATVAAEKCEGSCHASSISPLDVSHNEAVLVQRTTSELALSRTSEAHQSAEEFVRMSLTEGMERMRLPRSGRDVLLGKSFGDIATDNAGSMQALATPPSIDTGNGIPAWHEDNFTLGGHLKPESPFGKDRNEAAIGSVRPLSAALLSSQEKANRGSASRRQSMDAAVLRCAQIPDPCQVVRNLSIVTVEETCDQALTSLTYRVADESTRVRDQVEVASCTAATANDDNGASMARNAIVAASSTSGGATGRDHSTVGPASQRATSTSSTPLKQFVGTNPVEALNAIEARTTVRFSSPPSSIEGYPTTATPPSALLEAIVAGRKGLKPVVMPNCDSINRFGYAEQARVGKVDPDEEGDNAAVLFHELGTLVRTRGLDRYKQEDFSRGVSCGEGRHAMVYEAIMARDPNERGIPAHRSTCDGAVLEMATAVAVEVVAVAATTTLGLTPSTLAWSVALCVANAGVEAISTAAHLPFRLHSLAAKEFRYGLPSAPASIVHGARREVEMHLRLLGCSGVVALMGVWLLPRITLLLEPMDGGNLHQFVRGRCARGWAVDTREAASLVADVADGLAALHAKCIVHRDVKSHNVMIIRRQSLKPPARSKGPPSEHGQQRGFSNGRSRDARSGRTYEWVAKLGDLGSASLTGRGGANTLTEEMGTSGWTAPEVLSGRGYGVPADIFSLGILAWDTFAKGQLDNPLSGLSGEAYTGALRAGIRPPLPALLQPVLAHVVERCWAFEPCERPPAETVAAELRAFVSFENAATHMLER